MIVFENKPSTKTPINDKNLNANFSELLKLINDKHPAHNTHLVDGYNIDTIKKNGQYGIFNATGTLPDGYVSSDNNFLIECIMWNDLWGRQILYNVRRTGEIYTRILSNGTWLSWLKITTTS